MPPRRTLLLLPLLLTAVGCRELLWHVERADETMHRNVGALFHRAEWLTVPRYQEPSGFSSTYREHLDRFDATHPNPAFVPQAGVGRTRPVHGIRGPVDPAAWSANAAPSPTPPAAGAPPAPIESRAPEPQSATKPVAARVPTAGRSARMPAAPRTSSVAPVAPASVSRADGGATKDRTTDDDLARVPPATPRDELLGRIRWSRLFARAEAPPRAAGDSESAPPPTVEPVAAASHEDHATSESSAPREAVAEEESRTETATIGAPAPAARGPFRALLDRLIVARRPSMRADPTRDDSDSPDSDADDEDDTDEDDEDRADEDWDEADLFDETDAVRPPAATKQPAARE